METNCTEGPTIAPKESSVGTIKDRVETVKALFESLLYAHGVRRSLESMLVKKTIDRLVDGNCFIGVESTVPSSRDRVEGISYTGTVECCVQSGCMGIGDDVVCVTVDGENWGRFRTDMGER